MLVRTIRLILFMAVGAWLGTCSSSLMAEETLIPVGVPQAQRPHSIDEESLRLIRIDSEQRALVESRFFSELYTNPEALFRDFPELRVIIQESPFYRPDYWSRRLSGESGRRPSFHMSGADYFPAGESGFVVLEQNTTNIGGVLELWRMQRPGSAQLISAWLRRLESLDSSSNAFRLYFTEERSFGVDWPEFRKKFREQFGWVLVSGSEIAERRFEVRDGRLYFLDDSLEIREVTAFASHFEPDLYDPKANQYRPLNWNDLVVHHKVAELRALEIQGLESVMASGRLVTLNEPGQDISSSKALLAFMPQLRKRYLGEFANEIIPTVETKLFVGSRGEFLRERLNLILSDPKAFVIKDHYRIGGGDGVYLLEFMSPQERSDLLVKITKQPHRYLYQPRIQPRLTSGLYRVELRAPVVVEADLERQTARVVASSESLFGRGSSSSKANLGANLAPAEANRVLSEAEARVTASFVVRVEGRNCSDLLPLVIP